MHLTHACTPRGLCLALGLALVASWLTSAPAAQAFFTIDSAYVQQCPLDRRYLVSAAPYGNNLYGVCDDCGEAERVSSDTSTDGPNGYYYAEYECVNPTENLQCEVKTNYETWPELTNEEEASGLWNNQCLWGTGQYYTTYIYKDCASGYEQVLNNCWTQNLWDHALKPTCTCVKTANEDNEEETTNVIPKFLAGDFDGDGNDDLFVYRKGTGKDKLRLSNGDGSFSNTAFTVNGYYEPFVGDFDGNGVSDIFWYSAVGKSSKLWLAKGNGTFDATSHDLDLLLTPFVGDFDGNGASDIFWSGFSISISNGYITVSLSADALWLAKGNGKFDILPLDISGSYKPFVGDYNADGLDDVFIYRPGTEEDDLLLSNGDGTFTTSAFAVNGTYEVAVGDFDGNGSSDIFWYRAGEESDALWLSNGDGTFAKHPRTINGNYEFLVGDFNADGIDDIFWRARDLDASDTLLLAEGDGTFDVTSWNLAPSTLPYQGRVGDYNGDGASDIFWQLQWILGGNRLWLSNSDGTFAEN